MKKLSIVLGLLLAFAALPAFAEEQGTSVNPTRDDFEARKSEIQEKIKENKDRLKDSREDLKKDLKRVDNEVKKEVKGEVREMKREVKDERREDRKEDRRDNSEHGVRAQVAIRVFEATIVRLETLVGRIDSRITKLSQLGASTTEATAFVGAAKTSINSAKAHIVLLKSIDLRAGTSTATSTDITTEAKTNRPNLDKLKAEVKATREDLTNAKQSLMRAVTAIKKIENLLRKEGKIVPSATSTATTTATSTTP